MRLRRAIGNIRERYLEHTTLRGNHRPEACLHHANSVLSSGNHFCEAKAQIPDSVVKAVVQPVVFFCLTPLELRFSLWSLVRSERKSNQAFRVASERTPSDGRIYYGVTGTGLVWTSVRKSVAVHQWVQWTRDGPSGSWPGFPSMASSFWFFGASIPFLGLLGLYLRSMKGSQSGR